MGPYESISKLSKLGHWNTLNKLLKFWGGGVERCEEIQKTRNDWFAMNLPYGLHHGGGGAPLYNYKGSHKGAKGPSIYE